jgi:ribulose 1,5-bisphosphate carboxylase large subunit-like protein
MSNIIFDINIDPNENIVATYFLESKTTLEKAAWELAIGQSVGNPNVRNEWETDDLFIKYSCKVMHDKTDLQKKTGIVKIAFPIINTDWEEDGISHLLCQLMGGQMDIDNILKCHLLKLDFPQQIVETYFKKPKQGIDGIRKYTNVHSETEAKLSATL